MKRLLAVAILGVASLASAKETVPFVADDYPKAVAQAKAKRVPIFVEAWAPW